MHLTLGGRVHIGTLDCLARLFHSPGSASAGIITTNIRQTDCD
jgi:hypothetical protein